MKKVGRLTYSSCRSKKEKNTKFSEVIRRKKLIKDESSELIFDKYLILRQGNMDLEVYVFLVADFVFNDRKL